MIRKKKIQDPRQQHESKRESQSQEDKKREIQIEEEKREIIEEKEEKVQDQNEHSDKVWFEYIKNKDQYILKDLSLCSRRRLIFYSIIWQFFYCFAITFIFYSFTITYRSTIDSYWSSFALEIRLIIKVGNRVLSSSLLLHSYGERFFRVRYFDNSKPRSKTSLINPTTSTSFRLLESVVIEWTSVFLAL